MSISGPVDSSSGAGGGVWFEGSHSEPVGQGGNLRDRLQRGAVLVTRAAEEREWQVCASVVKIRDL